MITEEEYRQLLAAAESLIKVDPTPESLYGRRLMEIVPLIEEYEHEHYPFMAPARSAGLLPRIKS